MILVVLIYCDYNMPRLKIDISSHYEVLVVIIETLAKQHQALCCRYLVRAVTLARTAAVLCLGKVPPTRPVTEPVVQQSAKVLIINNTIAIWRWGNIELRIATPPVLNQ